MTVWCVKIGDSWLSKNSIDIIGYYSTYNKAYKALKCYLEDVNMELSEPYHEINEPWQGDWTDDSDNGIVYLEKIVVE
ncbi:hypothetical protein A9K75_08600 [Campylobacter fetus subsp. testudinum]|uniref:hypothetical protein n=1 Tax=Campylobacter fetus TaxID=196 RepID=UPI000818A765|nr:hypothetical protein [Campylobacter fetus]OCR99061.1 hypothetical protein A9K75_08600 [Campylobacter fetus subsp. testudinum]